MDNRDNGGGTEPKKKNGIPSIVKVLCGFIGIILVAAITATFFREDNNMGLAEIFIIIGLVGIVAFIIMRIAVFSRKQYLKLANIGLVVCLAVFIGSIIIFAVGEDKRRSDFANDAFFENFTIKLTPSDDVQRTPKATDAVSTPTRDIISAQTVEPTASGTPTPEPTRTINIDNSSTAQINALKSAKSYLDIMPFSYEGLIEQLEYEGFTHEQAVYGADKCGADWNEQAVKSAESYLDIMPFSYEGLIEQLEYEGFTHEQAVYGAKSVGLDE